MLQDTCLFNPAISDQNQDLANPLFARIDIEKQPDGGCLILAWTKDWMPGHKPFTIFRLDRSFDELLDEVKEEEGWTIYEWGNGARAWLGEPRVVRTGSMIRKKRNTINQNAGWYRDQGVELNLNLAFYL